MADKKSKLSLVKFNKADLAKGRHILIIESPESRRAVALNVSVFSLGRHPQTAKRINKIEKFIVKNNFLKTQNKLLNAEKYSNNVRKHKSLNYSKKLTKILNYIYDKNDKIEYNQIKKKLSSKPNNKF